MNTKRTNIRTGKSSPPTAGSWLIKTLRCVTDDAIHKTLLTRSEICRVLREEAAIIEAFHEHDKTPTIPKS